MPLPGSSAEHPRRILAALGFRPRKSLGQNFLHDGNVARKIVAAALPMGGPFLEIGAGLGALTVPLLAAGGRVTAVEIDRTLAGWLRERLSGSPAEILEGDFLEVPDAEWSRRFPRGATAVGNLPYAVSSPVVLRLLELRETLPRAVLMLQKEMAERLCAPPGGREYGILSVYLAALGEARLLFPVRRTCFTPPPEVDSAVVSVRFRRGVPEPLFRNLRLAVRAAFARRRKTLRNAPVPFLAGGTAEWLSLLSRAGIDPALRAEAVPAEGFLALAGLLPPGDPSPGRIAPRRGEL